MFEVCTTKWALLKSYLRKLRRILRRELREISLNVSQKRSPRRKEIILSQRKVEEFPRMEKIRCEVVGRKGKQLVRVTANLEVNRNMSNS